jgi:predicted  nucleic acid-binding Zn-ribbon protein
MPNEIKLLTEEDCKDIDVFLDGCVPPDYDPCGTTYDWLHRAMETIRRLQLDLRHQTGRADLAEARLKESEKEYHKYDIEDVRLLDRLEAQVHEALARAEQVEGALSELIEAGEKLAKEYFRPKADMRPLVLQFEDALKKAEKVWTLAKEANDAE